MTDHETRLPFEAHEGDAIGATTALEGDEAGSVLTFSGDAQETTDGQ